MSFFDFVDARDTAVTSVDQIPGEDGPTTNSNVELIHCPSPYTSLQGHDNVSFIDLQIGQLQSWNPFIDDFADGNQITFFEAGPVVRSRERAVREQDALLGPEQSSTMICDPTIGTQLTAGSVGPRAVASPVYDVVTASSPPPGHGVECLWGGPANCAARIKSTTFSAIEAHLKAAHFENDAPDSWTRGKRGYCQWHGCTWGRAMYCRSLAKHIATQHLKTMVARCTKCNEVFTRGDAMRRHMHRKHSG
ncbi:hypothetical protein AcV5_000373 [Taiwanofungus camphoratus]|nr:hypothetical protein AcV5_000373 [Antrodia cinnamomea]